MSAPATTATLPAPPRPHVTVRGEDIPVVLPNRRDPRLKLSAVIITLHVLGQTLLGFKVTIAQILVTMIVCGAAEAIITFRSARTLVWPASGILTGSSVAFILRASGTRHGDWFGLHGIQFFVLAGIISLIGKHLIRPSGRHLFNPSNIGIVWCLLVIGPNHVFAQYLWWGPNRVGVTLAYLVILAGAVWILRSVRMVEMAMAFLVTFAVLTGIFALAGHSFIAIWHVGPVSGMQYWANLAISPEVMVFVFFMISDPQTAPKARSGRIVYGAAIAAVAATLIYFQRTEFGIKVAILTSLTVICALVPFIEAASRRLQARAGQVPTPTPGPAVGDGEEARPRLGERLAAAARRPAVIAAVIIAVAAPLDAAAFSHNKQVVLIERGEVGHRNAQ